LDVSLISLQKANEVTNSFKLYPGTTLVIPEGAPPYGVYPALENPASEDSTLGQGGGGNVYVVQIADTLDTIAAENNLQIQCLVDVNQLEKPGLIRPGQMLVLDATCPPYEGSLMPIAPETEIAPEPVATEESPAG
jgi:LysM repeat protein